jgi:hypothetical protein
MKSDQEDVAQDHWLPGFNFNVDEWDAEGLTRVRSLMK